MSASFTLHCPASYVNIALLMLLMLSRRFSSSPRPAQVATSLTMEKQAVFPSPRGRGWPRYEAG